MTTPLLITKLHRPRPRPGLAPRPRLLERLNQGVQYRPALILVSAPVGFGKTTLISHWLQQLDLPAAWLSLDPGDNDPHRFLNYFIAALRQFNPEIGRGVQVQLHVPPTPFPPLEELITNLINDISATETEFILVLDDYHHITAPAAHSLLHFLLDHPPPQLHLVILGRSDPPLPLPRWRARGQLVEIRATDLRFTPEETRYFFNTTMALNLPADAIAILERRTEGWIAGLQLAALSLQAQPHQADFISAFAGDDRYIADYLLDEVFSHQPPAIQTFLLQTSILDQLCGPLGEAVVDRSALAGVSLNPAGEPGDAQQVLEYLEGANLFIIPLDNKREWYRYHHLFSELLRHRLRQWRPQQVAELHRRAAHWYKDRGLPAQALPHLLAAGQAEEAASFLEQVGPVLFWGQGEYITLLNWLEQLPTGLLQRRPKLCLYYAEIMYLAGRLEAIEHYLQAAETQLRALENALPPEERQNLLGEMLAIRALAAGSQANPPQATEAIELAHQALQLLPANELRLRGLLTIGLAEAYYLDANLVAAGQTYQAATELAWGGQNIFLALAGLIRLVEVQLLRGQLHQALETCQHILAIAGNRYPQLASGALIQWGEILREWNQLEAAAHHLHEGLRSLQSLPHLRPLLTGYISLARVRQAQGEPAEALTALQQAISLARQHPEAQYWDRPPVAAYQARLWLAQGQTADAAHWAATNSLILSDPLNPLRTIEYLTLARLYLVQNQVPAALELLARLQQLTSRYGRTAQLIEVLMLQALAWQQQQRTAKALAALGEALSLAEPQGYIRLFLDEGDALARLLYQAMAAGITPAYTGQLLAAWQSATLSQPPPKETPTPLLEPLTGRELEVLQLIAKGLTNPQIAEMLFLTPGTVKIHAHNIYGKLGVTNRAQAVARATALGLLT